MSFADILNKPLPSKEKEKPYTEGTDDNADIDKELNDLTEECKTEDSEFGDNDPVDLTDEELKELLGSDPDDDDDDTDPNADLSDIEGLMAAGNGEEPETECGSCGGAETECGTDVTAATGECGADPEVPGPEEAATEVDPTVAMSVDDPTPAAPLEGEDDTDADNMMTIVATPMILNDTLTEEEARDFLESGDADIAIAEDLLLEEAMDEMVGDLYASGDQAYTESVFASPNRPYKMTKKARFNQLYELSLQIEARYHHDPFVPRIEKAYKIERQIKAGWRKRYGALAKKRAMNYLKRLMHSNSKGLKKAAKRMAGK